MMFTMQRDLAALNNKIKVLSRECDRLCSTYRESSGRVRGKEREVVKAWDALLTRSKSREGKLVEAEQLQQFLNTFRDLRYSYRVLARCADRGIMYRRCVDRGTVIRY